MTTLRFGVMIFPDAGISALVARMRHAEALGFDQLVLPDHIGDLRDLSRTWHDTPTLLAVAATVTRRIRIGTLVANPMLRPPAVTAKQAMTLDHLSNGRLDLGLGAGIFPFDHQATGTQTWPVRERMQRFAEYTQIVDGVLRGTGAPFSFDGRWLWAHVWNTHGPPHAGLDDIVALVQRQNQQLDDLCTTAGRDPATLRRSLTLFGATDPWTSTVTLEQVVERFTRVGIEEFVIHWPPIHRSTEIDQLSRDLIPTLR